MNYSAWGQRELIEELQRRDNAKLSRLDAIIEECEAYIAINGTTGAWGESMNDGIAIETIIEQVKDGHEIDASENRDVIKHILTALYLIEK